jgi:hypothetical protein
MVAEISVRQNGVFSEMIPRLVVGIVGFCILVPRVLRRYEITGLLD